MDKSNDKKKTIKKKIINLVLVTIMVAIFTSVYFNFNTLLGKKETQSSIDSSAEVMQNADLSIHYINVGQGDSVFIELPDDTTMLIDAGTEAYGDDVVNYIKGLGYTNYIDYVIVTHGDADHVGGITEVLETFEAGEIYRPFQFAVKDGVINENDDLKSLYNASVDKNVITTQCYNNFINKIYTDTDSYISTHYDGLELKKVEEDGFNIEFFGPLKTATATKFEPSETGLIKRTHGYESIYYNPTDDSERDNSGSCIMLLEYAGGSYLFTGDAIAEQEVAVINSLNEEELERFKEIDVFHVGHHGSRYSSDAKFLEVIQPKISVISEGHKYGHPHTETLERLDDYSGDRIYTTYNDGNILVLANETDIQINTNTLVGSLETNEVGIDPVEYWYVYVILISGGTFVSGLVYIMKQNYKDNQRSRKRKRAS